MPVPSETQDEVIPNQLEGEGQEQEQATEEDNNVDPSSIPLPKFPGMGQEEEEAAAPEEDQAAPEEEQGVDLSGLLGAKPAAQQQQETQTAPVKQALDPNVSAMMEQNRVLSQQVNALTQTFGNFVQSAMQKQQQQEVAASAPRPPPADAPIEAHLEYIRASNRWETQREVNGLRQLVQELATTSKEQLAAANQAAQEAQVRAESRSLEAQHSNNMQRLLAIQEFSPLRDKDVFSAFSRFYTPMCLEAGDLLDPIPIAKAFMALGKRIAGTQTKQVNKVANQQKVEARKVAQAKRPKVPVSAPTTPRSKNKGKDLDSWTQQLKKEGVLPT